MIRHSVGLFVEDGRVTGVVLGGRDRPAHFVVEGVEDPAGTIDAELRARSLRMPRIGVGLDRRAVVVKTLELPSGSHSDLGRMVSFELERHVPFPADEICSSWVELPTEAGQSRQLLVTAVGRHSLDRPLDLLARAKRRPTAVMVASHELPGLLSRPLPGRRAIWAHRHGTRTDLLLLSGATLLMSRSVAVADPLALTREIHRSLPLVGWDRCDVVWLSGDGAAAWTSDRDLAAALDTPVSAPPYDARRSGEIAALPPESHGGGLPALAVALGARRPAFDLLPAGLRPWKVTRPHLVTAGIVCATLLLGLTFAVTHLLQSERYLKRVDDEIRRLDPEAKAVDALAAERERTRRVLAGLDSARDASLAALPILRDLTEALPETAWLQIVNMDREGVELIGQADAANRLIPILEASPWLERVEFTSPVTQLQGREQFRIRGAWEAARPASPTRGR
jgi:general secretion pathway protein L